MTHIKRFLYALLFSLSLTACGGDDDAADSGPDADTDTDTEANGGRCFLS
jgi:hypothetical protein